MVYLLCTLCLLQTSGLLIYFVYGMWYSKADDLVKKEHNLPPDYGATLNTTPNQNQLEKQ